ncbi:MBL fold metallo-hydrolase [Asanoa sp. WMMD1127]|uniref:MBL fold metallo-hydrolase n=1 Tax=Asanoa sp. WMMD1127 TaxID=3016107 RepID=UPI0024178D44|nr:MBL fold metallo-hydrolase [Asanoa sp. WMMD1127]MDG4821306.1 MBL fold metallo-hydrolase [Asanoa sp. WMMD1127]
MFDPNRVRRRLEAARRSARDWPPSFADRLTAPLPSGRDVARMAREKRPDAASRRRAGRAIAQQPQPKLHEPDPNTTAVTWIGHASFVLQTGGLTILTDPVWSRRIPPFITRYTAPGVAWEGLPRIDAVLISHNHYDHLDAPTISRLPRDTPMLVPANLGWWFRRRGFRDVTDLDWWEVRRIGPVTFTFVPAHHWSRRSLADTNKSLWGGWIIAAEGQPKIYFAGDTGYGSRFAEIADRQSGIELALLPIGAYEPRWFMRNQHMDPEEAVQAAADLGARRVSGMHWGTFVLSTEPLLAPVERLATAWHAAGRDADDLWRPAIGETRTM